MKKFLWILCAAALIVVVVLFAFTNQRNTLQDQITGLENEKSALSQQLTSAEDAAKAAAAEAETKLADALAAAETDKQAALDQLQEAADAAVAAKDAEIEALKASVAEKETELDAMTAAITAKDDEIEALVAAAEQAKIEAENEKLSAIEAAIAKAKEGMVTAEEKAAAVADAVKEAVADMIPSEEHIAQIKEEVEKALEEAKTKFEEEKQGIIEKAQEGLYTLEQVKEMVTQKVDETLQKYNLVKVDEAASAAIPSFASYAEAILGADAPADADCIACALSYMIDVLPAYGFTLIPMEDVKVEDGEILLETRGEAGSVCCTIKVTDAGCDVTVQADDSVDLSAPCDGEVPDIAELREKYADIMAALFPETAAE